MERTYSKNIKLASSASSTTSSNIEHKFAFSFNSPISSFASDKDCKLYIIGGRETLKLMEINFKDEKFQIKRNLKFSKDSTRQNTVHVEWNPTNSARFAAAALSGAYSVWDVSGIPKPLNYVKAHAQAINKFNWHPFDQNTLVTGSHEGSFKIWYQHKVGLCEKNLQTSNTESIVGEYQGTESIRDVKFIPSKPEQLIVAFENGTLELFDRRKLTTCVLSNKNAHQRAILTLEFSPSKPNIFATGSMDKQIKFWDIKNIENEIEKVRNINGVNLIKWRIKEPDEFCVSSFSGDSTLAIWSRKNLYQPKYVLRGHDESITACNFDPSEKYAVTGSKDGLLIVHKVENAYQPFTNCNRFGLTFDLDNTVAFSFNKKPLAEEEKPASVFPSFEGSMEPRASITQMPKNIIPRKLYMATTQEVLDESQSKFKDKRNEVKYFAERYKVTGNDLIEICEYNANLARIACKSYIVSLWKDLSITIKDFLISNDAQNHHGILSKLNNDIDSPNSSILLTRTYSNAGITSANNTLTNIITPAQSNQQYSNQDMLNVEQIITYYEKNKELFKSDLDNKRIVLKNNKILIKHLTKREIITALENQKLSGKATQKPQINMKSLESLTNNALVNMIQSLINRGELQTAYAMYSLLCDNKVHFPENQVLLWAQAYIELLRTFEFYKLANESICSSKVAKINEISTVSCFINAQ